MDKYFAADEAEKAVENLMDKSKKWFLGVNDIGYIDKIKRSWYSYYGNYYNRDHSVSFGGEQGELVNIAVNHYRNIARNILTMVTSTRPSFQCRAINTDRKSLIQAKLGNGLLDYYMREMGLETILKDAVEYAIVLGSGYIKLEWNSTKGKIYDYLEVDPNSIADFDEDGNPLDINGNLLEPMPIYEGDAEFGLLSPFDVVFDPTKEHYHLNDWVLCRTAVNKFDLAAKYPEYKELLLKEKTKDETAKHVKRVVVSNFDETVDIYVYEFFHKRTESMPNGRYILYVNRDIILNDSIMPYRELPVYRIVPSQIIGTPYGYTDLFDLLPLQDMLNSLYSTATTNINAFGVQNILNPRGNGVSVEQITDGMNFIEYNPAMGKPEPLELVRTSPEVYRMIEMMTKDMETLSGVNSVVRGNPEAQLRSGNALALVQSQALQYMSGLQQSYIKLLENVGTGIINLLKDFASTPRVAAISGVRNATKMTDFKSDDIKAINRVVVDVGNALMSSTAGRAQVAENLLQMGLIKSPEKYLMVLNTGSLDFLMEGEMDEMFTIKAENEALVKNEEVVAIYSDNHALHIREHKDVLSDPILRKDPDLVARALAHMQEHIELLRTIDPDLLALTGNQSLAPQPQPGQPPMQGNVNAADQNLGAAQMLDPNMGEVPLPNLPKPAGEGTILPEGIPQTPEEMMLKNV